MAAKRIFWVFLGLTLLFAVLVYRLYDIQIVKHAYYIAKAEKQQLENSVIPAERGEVRDRNGVVLAFTREDISVSVDKRMLNKNSESKLISGLSAIFHKNPRYYSNLIELGDKNILLEKKVSKAVKQAVEKLNSGAIIIKNDFSRIYPYGSLASHLIGYISHEKKGAVGVESEYDNFLKGEPGIFRFEKSGRNQVVAVDEDASRESVSGNNLVLTIDKKYQKITEEELLRGLKKYGGESAVAIIMNPKTGEILSLANLPNYDPANYNLFDDNARRNRAVTDTYEPGSTIKPIILSILLKENLVNENDVVNAENGVYKFRNTFIRDAHKFNRLTVKEVIEHSSNIGMSKIIGKASDKLVYKYLRDYGFGNPTSIDLPGEASGLLKRPEDFDGLTKAFLSFGYQISVTPMQMITAYSAIINGGYLNQPYIVKKIVDSGGRTIKENYPKHIRKVIDGITSERIKSLLVGVVEEGTGMSARIDDMFVGGKTGTAQILIDGKYSHIKYNSSFIGYFPAEDPQAVIFVLYTSPEKGRYGGSVAAPVFKRIAQRIINSDVSLSGKKKKIRRRNEAIEQFKIALNDRRENYSVFNNIPAEKQPKKQKFVPRETMPSLRNYSLRNAIAQLSELGLKYSISGKSGKVVYQSIKPGEKIKPGDVCLIKCENSKKSAGLRLN